jgi:hypothetical protein
VGWRVQKRGGGGLSRASRARPSSARTPPLKASRVARSSRSAPALGSSRKMSSGDTLVSVAFSAALSAAPNLSRPSRRSRTASDWRVRTVTTRNLRVTFSTSPFSLYLYVICVLMAVSALPKEGMASNSSVVGGSGAAAPLPGAAPSPAPRTAVRPPSSSSLPQLPSEESAAATPASDIVAKRFAAK